MIFLIGLFLIAYGLLGNFFGTDGSEFICVGLLIFVLYFVVSKFGREK